jgi:biotin carboxyl carrier protein
MNYTVIVSGETVEVEFKRTQTGIEATIGDRTYVLEASTAEAGVYWFNWNGQSMEVFVWPNGSVYSVAVGSHSIAVEILDDRAKLKRTAQHRQSGAAEIRAPMPGKIVRVLVGEDANVEPNQGIVVMEAMKMQNEIKSPSRGKIQKLAVTEGETVRSGDLIAVVK